MSSRFGASALLCLLLSAAPAGAAVPATVTVNSAGRDLNEAMLAAVRSAVKKSVVSERLTKAVLEEEIVPAYSQLVGQYKVTDGSEGGGAVGISATVDLVPVQNLLSFTPEAVGVEAGSPAKAVLVFRAEKLAVLDQLKIENPHKSFEKVLRERLSRRGFEIASDTEAVPEDESGGHDVSAPEVLRMLAARAEADVALGIAVGPGEDTEKGGWQMRGTLLQRKGGRVLGRFTAQVALPRQKKETAQGEWNRALLDAGNQVLLSIFSRAGAAVAPRPTTDDSLVIRIVNPSGVSSLEKFRAAAIKLQDVDALVERSAGKGFVDYTVQTRLALRQLEARLKSAVWDGFDVELARGDAAEVKAGGLLLLKMNPKEQAADPARGGNP